MTFLSYSSRESVDTTVDHLQAPKFFRQLHQFFPERNEWSLLTSQNCPDGKAGHGATIVDNKMVVFGGCHGFENRLGIIQYFENNNIIAL